MCIRLCFIGQGTITSQAGGYHRYRRRLRASSEIRLVGEGDGEQNHCT